MTGAAGPATGGQWDGGLAFRAIVGETAPDDVLLRLIAERLRVAAGHLGLSREDLQRIFIRHSVFEGEIPGKDGAQAGGHLLVETHHLIQGRVGKGALKLVFPEDLLGKGDSFRAAGEGQVEVQPPAAQGRWRTAEEAEARVRQAMRELMTGESLSMSLKSQATGAPFAGSEGLILCAARAFAADQGRYWLRPLLRGTDEAVRQDKELIEGIMNEAAALLTRARRIGYDQIVHAAETNSTLTSRLGLQLPTNVLEGHLRALLDEDPHIIIGDTDMTTRLQELRARRDYQPTACALARAAAKMQMEHALLLPASRERLRRLLEGLPATGSPAPGPYRELMDLFFGQGNVQQREKALYHHREPILRALAVALSTRCLDECGDAEVLALYVRTLLDNQWILLERALARLLPAGQALPVGWFEPHLLLSAADQQALLAAVPDPEGGREAVKEAFWGIVQVLCEARDRPQPGWPEWIRQARLEVLERAIRAITATGEVVPTVDRLAFFTLPLGYECATPKLGVVTRKPVEVGGSELRPEAMAQGAMMALEIHLQRLTGRPRPLDGLRVAIEGLGNAGKNMAHLMVQQGATIVAVSDSRGAVWHPGGFTRQELAAIVAHKNAGRRFDTFLASPLARMLAPDSQAGLVYDPDPERLKQLEADVLVLTAIPASIRGETAQTLPVRVICELTGAAVSGEAKRVLKERGISVIPDNLGSSGGLLVSLSEMLQNSTGQVWDRELERDNLRRQLERSYEGMLRTAEEHDVDLATASDIVALRRMHELARYRERLELLARRLAARIRQIGTADRVLVLSDNDEDGVASAAILQGLVAHLNPGAEERLIHVNESFRSPDVLELLRAAQTAGEPIRQVYALDRAYPAGEPGRTHLAQVEAQCPVTFINNHPLPQDRSTALMAVGEADNHDGVLYVSPQTLNAPVPAEEFPTALVLRELASLLVHDERVLHQMGWQAAVGCCLDLPEPDRSEWLLFYSRYNPDRTVEAARAIRLVTRVRGYRNAIQALVGVERPDQLETHDAWGRFLAEYRRLQERVQVLVERIEAENRGRPYAAHFFTDDEVASPTPIAGNDRNELDFYHWISEPLTERGDLAERPILVGQVVPGRERKRFLGLRIRSPRGVDLGAAGLPAVFQSGGLPNTAIARVPLEATDVPSQVFQQWVEAVWRRAAGS